MNTLKMIGLGLPLSIVVIVFGLFIVIPLHLIGSLFKDGLTYLPKSFENSSGIIATHIACTIIILPCYLVGWLIKDGITYPFRRILGLAVPRLNRIAGFDITEYVSTLKENEE